MPYEAAIKNALLTIFFSNIGYIIDEVMFFFANGRTPMAPNHSVHNGKFASWKP